jgi:tRNA(Phe) wybutosine-synthesizing methylase Tyw3
MCQWGDSLILEVTVPAHLSYTGEARRKKIGIDRCIAPIVKALNDAGIVTVSSCCGHGKRPGDIALADGRELIICHDFETARQVDNAFPPIHDEQPWGKIS